MYGTMPLSEGDNFNTYGGLKRANKHGDVSLNRQAERIFLSPQNKYIDEFHDER